MALIRLLVVAILIPKICRVPAESPPPLHPCFSSEAVPTNERRFFSFAPANVRSQPPVDCVFVFGGPPGSFLRLGLYDVKTKGPKVFRGQESASQCQNDVIRVYDLDRKGLQLRAAYCGVLRRGKMLSMSSNMAVITYTSDSNDPANSFNLGVDAVEAAETTTVTTTTGHPCVTTASTPSTTLPASMAGGEPELGAAVGGEDGGYGEWGASGDTDESGEQGAPWYVDGSVVRVTSTAARIAPAPREDVGAEAAETLGVEETANGGATPEAKQEPKGLEGEDAGKVVAVFSNGTGDEDDDAIAFYYYL